MWYWDFRKARETVAVWMVTFFVGIAVYAILGLAVTFKTTVEAAGKIRNTLHWSP